MPELKKSASKSFLPIDSRAWKGAGILLGVVFIGVLFFKPLAFLGILVLCCHLAFFREPSFKLPEGKGLASPAHGQVADIEVVLEDKFLHEKAYRIGIFMSVFVPHINLCSMQGKIGYLEHVPGKFINALRKDCSLMNESNWIGIENAGTRIMVRQITGAIARRIFWDVEVGTEVEPGEKLGVICYGSRVECYLPVRFFNPAVKVGDRIQAGSTLIGEWIS